MGYTTPIPVKEIIVGNQYYTCGWGGAIKVTVLEIRENTVLVKTPNNNNEFTRPKRFIFDNAEMAKCARRMWESGMRRRKR